ncbi:hypothetical protein KY290_011488 [Solanum tuberosum]|uniref:Uncharacterized protein n=1 Tax=Solanum tuberosum TaxID=4113 RepID=A0ABQ7W0U8_SOLTU|nr:hypothetical protein KY284_011594 [Solanum tuberosum]KAH0774351.1 hypothetical protein KY290_011488 [Solanum tuberosum]
MSATKTTNEDLELALEVGIKQLKYACKILELHLKYHVPEAYKARYTTIGRVRSEGRPMTRL